MANSVDIITVVKHLANGTLCDSICFICLNPLQNNYENMFTRICKEEGEFCVADVLGTLCQMEFLDIDNYNICLECFKNASSALQFYLQAKHSKEIIEFYTEQLLLNTNNINVLQDTSKAICISLPLLEAPMLNFSLGGLGFKNKIVLDADFKQRTIKEEQNDIVIIIRDGKTLYFKVDENGHLIQISEEEKNAYSKVAIKSEKITLKKPIRRRKRVPMNYKSCSVCPVKYRFVAKLKHHMKEDHNVELMVCKICKATTEDKQEFEDHMRTHTNIHQCAICSMVFKRRSTIISHLQWHEKMKNNEGAHICESCGMILEGEAELVEHKESKHEKKYTCYYCGKMYKRQLGFEAHIWKHEEHMRKSNKEVHNPMVKSSFPSRDMNRRPRVVCSTCGKDFVDQRALLWHQRLHTNERPYVCHVCGRGFVSCNRRNQHVTCAHSAPTKGCPLCPALFHLRSMVNTHVKRVHLQAHKRRNKASKYSNVHWRAEAVPIQELSVSIQNEIIQLKERDKLKTNVEASSRPTRFNSQVQSVANKEFQS